MGCGFSFVLAGTIQECWYRYVSSLPVSDRCPNLIDLLYDAFIKIVQEGENISLRYRKGLNCQIQESLFSEEGQ